MEVRMLLLVFFLPVCVAAVICAVRKPACKTNSKISDETFTVMLPPAVSVVGAACALLSLTVLLGFSLGSAQQPHFVFYVVFGLFFWIGSYLFLKALKFRVTVTGEEITVSPLFFKSYTFAFDEIVSVVRQVKINQTRSERIVIKTSSEKKFVVENAEIGYARFLQKITQKVDKEILFGF